MSSLGVSLNSALSALTVIQQQMTVASSNISNADVSNYTTESVDLTTQASGGQVTGVSVAGISTTIDQNLVRDIVSASSDASYAGTLATYYQTLQDYMGNLSSTSATGSTSDLASALSTLESDLSNLESTPSSESYQTQVVSDLDNLGSMLRSLSSEIQTQSDDAESDIKSTVSSINTNLQSISSLNSEIAEAKAAGQSTADLEDKRNTALESLAGEINVSYYVDSGGKMCVYSSGGQPLVDDSSAHQVSASSTSSGDTVSVNGVDITSQIQAGSLKASLDYRDTVLPEVKAELDNLASSLTTTVNSVYSQSTADPPPNSLTGTTTLSSSDSLSATGTVRIAVLDSSGDVVSYDDLDLSSESTMGDLVTALNGVSGVSASINAQGNLVIKSTNSSDGIAINDMSSSLGSSGGGFASYFGLNDLLTGDSAATIAVRSDILATPSLLATGSLSDASTLTVGSAGVSSGASDIVTSLAKALSASTSFSAAGSLGSTTTTFADYAGNIISGVATASSSASTSATNKDTSLSTLQTSFSNETGVNTDTETALLQQLETQYEAAAKVVTVVQAMFSALITAVDS